MKKTLMTSLMVSMLAAGCLAPVDDRETESVSSETAESELRNGIIIWVIDHDARRGEFTVEVEVDRSVVDDPANRYLIAGLRYVEGARGTTVEPYTATPMDQIHFEDIGRGRLSVTLTVTGPEPRNLDDSEGWALASATPLP